MKPANVGFCVNLIPRPETSHLLEARLKKIIPPRYPFQLQVQSISIPKRYQQGRKGATTTVTIIKANEIDISTISKVLQNWNRHKPQMRRFYDWGEWSSLNINQKLQVIQTQNKFMATYRSEVISGFCDNNELTMYKT